jgi:DNA-directed RNA polymerase specialized sigma24 family protein
VSIPEPIPPDCAAAGATPPAGGSLPLSEATTYAVNDLARGGDGAARQEIVRRFDDFIRSNIARLLRDRPAVQPYFDDIYQDFWFEWFKPGGGQARADRAHGNVRGWMYRILFHVVLRYEQRVRRDARRQGSDDVDLGDLAEDVGEHYRTHSREESQRHVHEALRTMTADPDPEVRGYGSLLGSRVESQSLAEIARERGDTGAG